jgi:hypothetical protein
MATVKMVNGRAVHDDSLPEGKFKVEVLADNSGKWAGNGLTFLTEEDAMEYGNDLSFRWTAVRDFRVVEVN